VGTADAAPRRFDRAACGLAGALERRLTHGHLRIAAFSDGEAGGNPAGVVLGDAHPSEDEMRRIAAQLGYSEDCVCHAAGTGLARALLFPGVGSAVLRTRHHRARRGACFARGRRRVRPAAQRRRDHRRGAPAGQPVCRCAAVAANAQRAAAPGPGHGRAGIVQLLHR
jgi:hypothetical protein